MRNLLAISPTPEALVAAAICRNEWDSLLGLQPDNIKSNLIASTLSSDASNIILILEGIADIATISSCIQELCESNKNVLLIASTRKTDRITTLNFEHKNFRAVIEHNLLDALAIAFPLITTRTPLSEELLSFDQELLNYIRYYLAGFFLSNGDSTALLKAINGFFDMIIKDDKTLSFPENVQRSLEQFMNMDFPYIECKSLSVATLRKNILKVSETNLNVLISGESSTCKQAIGFFIHDLGNKNKSNFIHFSCLGEDTQSSRLKLFGCKKGAIACLEKDYDGLISQAEGGTLFISNIQNMSLRTQAMLLDFLKTKKYCRYGDFATQQANIRIIATAQPNFNLNNDKVIPELYYRIAEAHLFTPPLRELKQDMWTIVRHIVFAIYRKGNNIDVKDTLKYFKYRLKYLNKLQWPGNIRELVVMVKRYAILGQDVIKELQLKKQCNPYHRKKH